LIEAEQRPRIIAPGIQRVIRSRHPELLVEGPAGTGKTYGLLEAAALEGMIYPGIRTLFIRATRKSMNESVLQLWEEEILGLDHPAVAGGAQRGQRSQYVFPRRRTVVDGKVYEGQSWYALVGMDSPERIMSSQYDRAYYFEATEGTLHQWELVKTRMRRFHTPYGQMVADCNPSNEFHWLNQRAEDAYKIPADLIGKVPFPAEGMKVMERVLTSLSDNPKYYNPFKREWTWEGLQYRMDLEQLTGVNYQRLVSGLWVSAEGQIWENYRRQKHVVQGHLHLQDGVWRLKPVSGETSSGYLLREDFKERPVAWFGISVDWGWHPDPGVMQLWAFDKAGRAFLVKERYQCKTQLDEWANLAAEWQAEYDVRTIVCDPSDPEAIDKLNERIGEKRGREGVAYATKANNGIRAGLDQVRWGFDNDETGEPRIRILANSPEVTCTIRKQAKRPTSWVQELGSYVYKAQVDGKPNKEIPDPLCEDHACDAARYMLMDAWDSPQEPIIVQKTLKPGQLGHKFDHDRVFKEAVEAAFPEDSHDLYD